jgi:hypothetical protein
VRIVWTDGPLFACTYSPRQPNLALDGVARTVTINALLSGVAMNFGKLLAWVGRFWLFLRAVIGGIFSHWYPLPAF